MRLNWCLAKADDVDSEPKPISIEDYTINCGMHLMIPELIDKYTLFKADMKPDDYKSILTQIADHFKNRMVHTLPAGVYQHKDLFWDGLSSTIYFYRDGIKGNIVQPGDVALVTEYLRLYIKNSIQVIEKYRLVLSRQRYVKFAPLEFYYTTSDIPDLDNL